MSAIPMPLEPWLQSLVDQWVLTPLEASDLQNVMLESDSNDWVEIPEHLTQPFNKIALHRLLDETATLH